MSAATFGGGGAITIDDTAAWSKGNGLPAQQAGNPAGGPTARLAPQPGRQAVSAATFGGGGTITIDDTAAWSKGNGPPAQQAGSLAAALAAEDLS